MKKIISTLIFLPFFLNCFGVEGEGLYEKFAGISEVVQKSPYTVKLTWTPVVNVEKYEIYLSTSDVPVAITSSTEYEITDLDASRQYIFAVNAVYFDGREEGISFEKSVAMWDKFKGLNTAVAVDYDEVALTWDYEHTDVTYYVYMGEASVDYSKEIKTTNSNQTNITGLKGDTTYKFAVTAKYADSRIETNTKELEARTLSAITPLPSITIDAVTMGISPNIYVSGAKATYKTDFYDENAVKIGFITGNGKVTILGVLQLETGTNEFYAIIADGLGNSTRVDGIKTVVKKFDLETPTLVPHYNGLEKPFVSLRTGSTSESGANDTTVSATQGYSNTQNVRTGDFNCDGYQDLVVAVPSGTADAESYCVDTSYSNTTACQKRSFGYILVYYSTDNGLEGVEPLIYNFENEAEGSLNYDANGGWGWSVAVGNFNGDSENGKSCDDIAISSNYVNQMGGFGIFYGSGTGLQVGNQIKKLQDMSTTSHCSEAGLCYRAFFVPPISVAPSALARTGYNRFGSSLATGDINGDGYTDLAVGMFKDYSDYLYQRVYIFFGSSSGLGVVANNTRYIMIEKGTETSTVSRFGANLALADLDNDGKADLFVTALKKNGFVYKGELMFIRGSLLSSLVLPNPNENQFQFDVLETTYPSDVYRIKTHPNSYTVGSYYSASFTFLDKVSDINGDGIEDIIVALNDDSGISNEGGVFIYAGSIYAIYGKQGVGPQYGYTANDFISGSSNACTGLVCKIQRIANPFRTQYCPNGVSNTYCYYASKISSFDINQDGYSDVMVSFPTKNKDTVNYLSGELDIYYGSSTGLIHIPRKLKPSTINKADMFGYISTAGLFRGAGMPPDLFVAAYHKDKIAEGRPEEVTPEGYVFKQNFNASDGIDQFVLNDTRAPSFTMDINYSKFENMYFDNLVFNAGDVNGDGYDDVLMKGASYYPDSYNARNFYVVIYYGSSDGIITELNSGCVAPSISMSLDENDKICPQIISSKYIYEELGGLVDNYFSYAVNGGGDVNGDGYGDIFSVGAGAYLFYGSNTGIIVNTAPLENPISTLDPKIIHSSSSNTFPNISYTNFYKTSSAMYGVSSLNGYYFGNGLPLQNTFGDFNGDGFSDLVFMSNSPYGAYIVYGSSSGIQSDGLLTLYNASTNPTGEILYSELMGTTDYPKQCEGDIPYLQCRPLRLAPGASAECGSAYSGVATGCGATVYTNTVRNLGDVNRDGYEDLVIIASNMTNYSTIARTFIYYGSKQGLIVNGQTHPENDQITSPQIIQFTDISGYYGAKFLTGFAGDINGDKYNDLVIGGSYNGSNMYIFYGSLNGIVKSSSLIANADYTAYKSCANGTPDGTNMPDSSCTQLRVATPAISGYTIDYGGQSGSMGIGDLNADGYDDILQTYANFYKTSAGGITQTGAVVVYFGSRYGLRTFKELTSNLLAVPKVTPDCLISDGLGCTPLIIMPDIPYMQLTKMSYFLNGDYNGDLSSDLLLGTKRLFYQQRIAKNLMNEGDNRLDFLPERTSAGHMWYKYQ